MLARGTYFWSEMRSAWSVRQDRRNAIYYDGSPRTGQFINSIEYFISCTSFRAFLKMLSLLLFSAIATAAPLGDLDLVAATAPAIPLHFP